MQAYYALYNIAFIRHFRDNLFAICTCYLSYRAFKHYFIMMILENQSDIVAFIYLWNEIEKQYHTQIFLEARKQQK